MTVCNERSGLPCLPPARPVREVRPTPPVGGRARRDLNETRHERSTASGKGSKGNHGAVVSLEMDLFPIGRLFGGGMYFGADTTDDVLRLYRSWVETVPEQMGSSVLPIAMPDIPAVPEPIRGRHVTHVRFAWSGPVEDGERWVRPFRELAPPLIDTTRDMPYREVGSIHNEPTAPVPFLARNSMLRPLDEAAIEPLLALAGPDAKAPFLVELRHFGGALSRAPQIPNAVGRRDGAFCVYTGSVVAPGREDECRAAQAALHDSLQPWSTWGVCLNFLTGPEIRPEILRSGYLPADFDRLVELKRRYDPENVFRINHNIDPIINET